MPQLHLLDGTYELFRSHFGAPPREAPDGRQIAAVHGIMASTLALLDEEGVTHLGAAFDTVIRSFRNDLYDGYKTEAGVPEELLDQFPIAEDGLEALGVKVWRMDEYEADDAIASAAHQFGDEFERVVMMSPDKDLAQCVIGERVVAFDRRRGIFYDEAGVHEKFGVAPESIPDYLGLVGDSSDGFPGVPGWGAKSAATVLAHYRHIEDIPLEAGLWKVPVRGAERLVAAMRENLSDALLFRYLALLRRDVPLGGSGADLEWRGVPRERFIAFCDRYDFDTLKTRPTKWV
ncbi:MAG TPA: 5'-3' exonuclease H3TH domain-containing protein [Acidimicrobiia bacterium]|nr:5'-3' exonuclease H3TH domain-containing protein [Acidimicrobiia bacterium]